MAICNSNFQKWLHCTKTHRRRILCGSFSMQKIAIKNLFGWSMMIDYDTWNWIAIFTLKLIPDLDSHRIHQNPVNEIFFAILELSFGIFTKGTRPQCIENSKSGPTAFDLYVNPVLSIAILIWIICLEHRLEDKMVRFGQSCSLQHLQSSLFSVLQARWNVGFILNDS